VGPFRIGTTVVSSSKIRDLIQRGEIEEAARLLGRDYPIIGKSSRGGKKRTNFRFSHSKI